MQLVEVCFFAIVRIHQRPLQTALVISLQDRAVVVNSFMVLEYSIWQRFKFFPCYLIQYSTPVLELTSNDNNYR